MYNVLFIQGSHPVSLQVYNDRPTNQSVAIKRYQLLSDRWHITNPVSLDGMVIRPLEARFLSGNTVTRGSGACCTVPKLTVIFCCYF